MLVGEIFNALKELQKKYNTFLFFRHDPVEEMASNGQDEVPFEYSLKNASDSDIEGVLEKSDKNLAYHRVVLSTNKLTLTPKISRYPQFQLVSHLNLWDNQITNISKENIPRNVQELDLGRNQIENVPSFAEFLHLRKLSLGQNKITVLSKDCIPPNVEILDLNGNKGLILPELSEHKKLRELYLMDCALTDFREEHCSYNLRVLFLDRNNLKKVVNIRSAKNLKHLYQRNNAIQHVNINHLPLGLEFLNLEDNGIKEFGNLKQFTSLKCLKVRGNKITRFVGLPVCLTDISLRFNPLQILDEECFPSEAVYNVWISNITDQQKSDLKQPPWNILSLGFDHVLRYFGALNDNDPNFYRPASSTKVVLPDPGYHNRFEVERKGERLTNSRNRLVLVGGTGVGKTSLTETLVHRKSVLTDKIKDRTKVVNIKTLKLTNQDTFKVFDQGGHEIYTITNTLFVSKKSTVFVCHDVSQCDEKSVEATVSIFKRTLQQQPKNNINLVLTHSDMLEDEEVTRNKNKLVSEVQQFLQKEVESMEKVQRATADSKEDTTKAEEVLHLYKNVKSSMKVFVVSSKTLAGIDQLKQFLTQKAESDRVVIPSVWTKMYEMIATKKEHCLVYHNVQKEYQHFFTGFQKLVKRKEKMVAECDDCLRYYHDIGLVFWFEEHPVLKNYIFHDIEFLIKVFRAILNHDFPTTLVYKEDQALQESFKEVEYESILHQYENEGLLPLSMMKFLWKHDLESEDVNALLELMKSFDICFEILSAEESKMQEPLYFFPWFVRIKTVPANFNIEDPMIVDNDTVSLMFECVFHNNIPVNICEILCVRLQKYAVMYHYHGQRQAWRDGLMITINRTECYIFRNDATSTISCCVRSPVEDIADAWTALQYAHTELETILAQWYGVIRSIHVVCSHCDFKSIIPPHRWPSREVWLADLKTKYVRCPKQLGENVPAVLVLPVGKR